jgi:hypothetical protein
VKAKLATTVALLRRLPFLTDSLLEVRVRPTSVQLFLSREVNFPMKCSEDFCGDKSFQFRKTLFSVRLVLPSAVNNNK